MACKFIYNNTEYSSKEEFINKLVIPSFINQPKTRRILELQSDLFQKGRNKDDLVGGTNDKKDEFNDEYQTYYIGNVRYVGDIYEQRYQRFEPGYSGQLISKEEFEKNIPRKKDTNENKFLQLLNKDSNWVTFFIKSIIQDSAKKGYEKVLFPKGETAAKIEGHETIAEEISRKDNELNLAIKQKEKLQIRSFKDGYKLYVGEVPQFDFFKNKIDAEEGLNAKQEVYNNDIKRLEQEKANLKSQGIEKLKPIEAFYEIKVGNILEKQFGKDNVKTITDEYGNEWREITINQTRDLSNILLQRNEANQIIGQANIKAYTVLVDAINQKQDTLPHEYAHHYIAWFRDTPIVQEAIKKWGSEEALVQSIGEQVVKQKGEAYNWWNEFVKWIMNQFNSLSKLQKEKLTQILTDAFLTRQDLSPKQDIKELFESNPEQSNVNIKQGKDSTSTGPKISFDNIFGMSAQNLKEVSEQTEPINKVEETDNIRSEITKIREELKEPDEVNYLEKYDVVTDGIYNELILKNTLKNTPKYEYYDIDLSKTNPNNEATGRYIIRIDTANNTYSIDPVLKDHISNFIDVYESMFNLKGPKNFGNYTIIPGKVKKTNNGYEITEKGTIYLTSSAEKGTISLGNSAKQVANILQTGKFEPRKSIPFTEINKRLNGALINNGITEKVWNSYDILDKDKALKNLKSINKKEDKSTPSEITPQQKQQSQSKQFNVNTKQNIKELFDSNPELANAVYEALESKQVINKEIAKSKHNTDEYRFSIGNFIKEKNSVRVTKNNEGDFSIHEGDLSELTKEQKILLFKEQSNAIPIGGQIVQRGASSFDGIRHRINLKNHGFSIKYQTDNLQEYKSTNKKEVQEFADLYNLGKVIEKDGKLFTKGVILTKEQNTNFVTTQQKQQAQQLYSQYLDSIFPDSKVKDIVYHGSYSKDIQKFDKSKFLSGEGAMAFGKGFYFTLNEETSFFYHDFLEQAKHNFESLDEGEQLLAKDLAKSRIKNKGDEFKGKVYSVLLNIQNPAYWEQISKTEKDKLKQGNYGNYDSVIHKAEGFTRLVGDQNKFQELQFELSVNEDTLEKGHFGAPDDIVTPEERIKLLNRNKEIEIELNKYSEFIQGETHYIIPEPEQIHILGSKQDIEGFKKFIDNNQSSEQTNDSEIGVVKDTIIKKLLKDEESSENSITFAEIDKSLDGRLSDALKNNSNTPEELWNNLRSEGKIQLIDCL